MIRYDNLFKQIKKASNIFIMSHKNLDLDAIGSSIALYNLASKYRKKVYIVIDETKHEVSVKKALKYTVEKTDCNIVKFADSKDLINDNSLLIIVDTYSEKKIQNPRILKHIKNILIIDHHLFGKPLNKNYLIDASSSSCSEMMGYLFKSKNYRINKYIANLLYGGIIIDTNSFSLKTSALTHEVCNYLLKCGASTSIVNGFIKSSIEDYIKVQKVIFKTEFYKKKYAIVIGNQNKLYDPDELAKISDTLLKFDNVIASFTIGNISEEVVGISSKSRQNSNIDVLSVMHKFDGNGSKNIATAQIENKTLTEIESIIKGELK